MLSPLMSNTSLITHIFFSAMSSFLSLGSVLTLYQFLLSVSVIPVSCFSWMCCQAFHFKLISISPLDFARNDSVPFRLYFSLQKKLKQRWNYILFHTTCTHYTQPPSSHWYDVTDCNAKNPSLEKNNFRNHIAFTSSKIYPLHNVRCKNTLRCTWWK